MGQTTHTSKSAVMVAAILGKVSTIVGWINALLFLIGLFGVSAVTEKAGYIIFCLIFIALGVLLIVYGKKTKDRIRRFREYIAVIANQNQTSIDQIANMVQMPVNFVFEDMKYMIDKKYFVGAYIDQTTNSIAFRGRVASAASNEDTVPSSETQVVICKNCGAQNQIVKGSVGECEYCGSPISSD